MTSAQCLAICATIFLANNHDKKTQVLAGVLYCAAIMCWAAHLAPV